MDPNLNQSTPQESIPQTPTIEKTKKFSKRLIFLISLLLAILIPISIYAYKKNQTPAPYKSVPIQTTISRIDPTASWKTFTATDNSFSFKYPSDWVTVNQNGIMVGLVPQEKSQDTVGVSPPILVRKMENPTNLSLEDWQNNKNSINSGIPYDYFNPAANGSVIKTQTTQVNGYIAYINTKGNCEPVFCYQEIIQGSGKFYIFENLELSGQLPVNGVFKEIYTKEDLQKNQQVFDQILSTFKFTAPTSTITPTTNSVPLSVTSIDPPALPSDYYSKGRTKMTVTGTGFQNGTKVFIEGPYDLATGEIMQGSTLQQFELTNLVLVSSESIEGTIPDGLYNSYYKVAAVNPDGIRAVTAGIPLLVSGSSY